MRKNPSISNTHSGAPRPVSSAAPIIEMTGVSRDFGPVQALREVSFRVEKSGVVGLLGQNGAGKTTLLRILTGCLAPSRGEVCISGADPILEAEEAKARMGYLPEVPPLYEEMSVREYLCFACQLKGVAKGEIAPQVEAIMERTGLTAMASRMLSHLSKGYRQRAGLAQALCGKPALLILDEPTVGLDPRQIIEIRELIREVGKECTVLFSTHILTEAQQLCDRILILEKGQLRLDTLTSALSEEGKVQVLCVLAAGKSIGGELSHIPGVTACEERPSLREGNARFLLTFEGEKEPERALFAFAQQRQVPLLHLSRVESSLEQIFLSTIAGE